MKSELEESRASPPLELRRGSPHDRVTDSPQVATVYVHGSRHLYYEPPPAHRPSQPRLQVATPPHASQVPPQADSLLMLLQVSYVLVFKRFRYLGQYVLFNFIKTLER